MFLHAIFPQSLLEDRLWMIIKYSSHMLPILFNKPFKTDGWPDESTTEQIRGAILQHCLFWSPLLLTTILQCKKTRIYVQGVPKHVSIVNFYTSNKRGKNKEEDI